MKKTNTLSQAFDMRSSGEKAAEKEIQIYRQLPQCPLDECSNLVEKSLGQPAKADSFSEADPSNPSILLLE